MKLHRNVGQFAELAVHLGYCWWIHSGIANLVKIGPKMLFYCRGILGIVMKLNRDVVLYLGLNLLICSVVTIIAL